VSVMGLAVRCARACSDDDISESTKEECVVLGDAASKRETEREVRHKK